MPKRRRTLITYGFVRTVRRRRGILRAKRIATAVLKMRAAKRIRRRYPRRRAARVRVTAPATVVAQTYYSNKVLPYMKKNMRTYKRESPNVYTYTDGNTLTAGSGNLASMTFNMMGKTAMQTALQVIGQQPASGVGQLTDTNRIFWKTAERYVTMTNSSNATAFLDIYHLAVRRDTNKSSIELWNLGLQDQDQTGTTMTAYLNSSPAQSQAFNDFYKIKRVYQIVLNPGQSHQHNTKHKLYRVINNDIIASDMQLNNYLAGISHQILIIARGAPVTDTNSAALVNTAPVKIDLVSNARVTMSYVADNDYQYTNATGTGMATAGNTVNVVNQMGIQQWNNTVNQTGYQAPLSIIGTTV